MYVLTIDCDHLGEFAARTAYILILKVSRHCHSAPQHGKSWNMGLIGRGTVHVVGVPTTVGHGPADHAYEVATSAEGPASRGGRSRPIVRQALFHRVPIREKELTFTRNTPLGICRTRWW